MIQMPIMVWLLLIAAAIYANVVQIWQFKKIRRLKEETRENPERDTNRGKKRVFSSKT